MHLFNQIFLVLSVCLFSLASHGYIHTDEELAEMKKEAEDLQRTLDTFSKNLSGETPSKYKSLRKALEAYATAHAENELNAVGTGWASAVDAAEKSVLKEFINIFKKLDSRHFEMASEMEFKKRDAELNRIYKKIQKNKNFDTESAAAPSRNGIKDTQRLWLQYRDAFLAFAALKFPDVSKSSLSALLTTQRVLKLKEITSN